VFVLRAVSDLVVSEAMKLMRVIQTTTASTGDTATSVTVSGSAPPVASNSSCTFSGNKLCKPPSKMSKLLAKYSRPTSASADQVQKPLTPLAEYHKYLAICDEAQQRDADDDDNGMDCLHFWHQHKKDLPIMYCLAMKVHSVPATSAPVERVFSHGGIVMRPHRSRLGDTILSNIVFLKCNE